MLRTLLFILFFLSFPAGWLTHVYVTIVDERWVFLLAGAICFPIAIVHGWGVWLGIF